MLDLLAFEFVFLHAALIAVLNLLFAMVSRREGKKRAVWIALGTAFFILLLFSGVFAWGIQAVRIAALALLVADGLALIFFFLPVGRRAKTAQSPAERIDERVIMFARARLRPGSAEYEAYYQAHPADLAGDERIRSHPGLLVPNQTFNPALLSAASEASFDAVEALRPLADGKAAAKKIRMELNQGGEFIRALARHYGALAVGFTELKPYHLYSHIGRGPGEYGAPIELDHTHAIAITVEMNAENVSAAPAQPITMESSRQYLNAGAAAVQLAAAIRRMGYEARAHIDGSYRVICPLVARDAGLGEIGRMGLLMTPRQGPRVRLAVVTTTLPLPAAVYQPDASLLDFCSICKKCAENCPSKAIPAGERTVINGALRWQIDQQRCFDYWCRIGTDCGRCLAVCPYAHPDHWLHNLVRWGIRHSGMFRRAAYYADHLFYGRKPRRKPAPEWARSAIQQGGDVESDRI